MKKPVIISLIVLFVLLGIGLIYFLAVPQATVGSSVLSIDKVDYFSSSSTCFDSSSQPLWVYTFRGGGLGQWAEGEVTPSEASSINDGDEMPKYSFKLDTKYNQYCVYPIVRDTSVTPIYKLTTPITWTCVGFDSNKAVEKCGGTWVGGKYGVSLKCWCSSYQKMTGGMGNTPNFNYPSTKTVMDVEVSSQGETYTETFTSNERIKGRVGSDVCIVWQGNTVTGDVCGLPSQTIIPGYINGQWKLLSKEYYTTYKSAYDNFLNTAKSGSATESKINELITDLNTKADRTLNSRISFGTIEEPTSQTNAKIIKTLSQLKDFPVITAYIKADWLGVVTPVPDPKIRSATSTCFSSGDKGTINVMIENVGDERGEVDVYGTCGSGFNVERKSVSFDAGEEKLVVLQITGTTSEVQLDGTCTITADAIDNKDTETVKVCVKGLPSCTIGEVVCIDNKIYECLDGIKRTMKEDCSAKSQVCNYDDKGVPFCAEEDFCELYPDDPKCEGQCGAWIKIAGKTIIPDLFCLINLWIQKFRITLAIVLGVLGGILGGLFSMKFIEKKKLKSKWWIILVIGLVLGGAIGFLVYTYFWTGVIILIVLGIIKAFVPGI